MYHLLLLVELVEVLLRWVVLHLESVLLSLLFALTVLALSLFVEGAADE